MKITSLVATSLLLISGPALAQTYYAEPVYTEPVYIETIQVRPMYGDVRALSMDCDNLYTPRPIDVESLLQVHDRTQTQQLSNKLVNAIADACRAGIPSIVVERGKSGQSVIWYPAGNYAAAVTSDEADNDFGDNYSNRDYYDRY